MRPRGFHHIGHAVDDIAAAVDVYERLFAGVVEHHETVPEQGVEAASFVSEATASSSCGRSARTRRWAGSWRAGDRDAPCCLAVDDIRTALRDAAAAGAELIDEEPHAGLFGLQVAFIHPSSVAGVLVEYVQVEGAVDG